MGKQSEFAVILKMNPMFADLGADELSRLSNFCHTQHLDADEVLFQKGDPGNALFGVRRGQIRIETPLIALRKHQIVTRGLELGAPFDLTWSCYSRDDQACGSCDSCALRLRAFAAAGAVDPIPYLSPTAVQDFS